MVIRKLVDSSIEMGWSSIIASIFFLGGLILIMLGMIGEYIGRIYISLNNAPQYTIREVLRQASAVENNDSKQNQSVAD